MTQPNPWNTLIPVEETKLAVKFLVSTWEIINKSPTVNTNFKLGEPKLTETLWIYLDKLKTDSGLSGFWSNEAQEPRLDGSSVIRIKKDITYSSNKSLRTELVFEFKKISSYNLANYRGENGMLRFVNGHYAIGCPIAFMVGLLNGSDYETVRKLENSLANKAQNQTKLNMLEDQNGDFVRNPSQLFESIAQIDTEHNRPKEQAPHGGGTTTLSHIFLECELNQNMKPQ